MDTGAPFERVATWLEVQSRGGPKGGATGRQDFVRHQDPPGIHDAGAEPVTNRIGFLPTRVREQLTVAPSLSNRSPRHLARRVADPRRLLGAPLRRGSSASTPSSSSGFTRTSRALEPSLGPTMLRDSMRSISRPGLGEADPQLALEHGRRAELGGDDQLGRLAQQVEVVADVLVDLLLRLAAAR